jgi:hypothetical protein
MTEFGRCPDCSFAASHCLLREATGRAAMPIPRMNIMIRCICGSIVPNFISLRFELCIYGGKYTYFYKICMGAIVVLGNPVARLNGSPRAFL